MRSEDENGAECGLRMRLSTRYQKLLPISAQGMHNSCRVESHVLLFIE